VLTRRDEVAGLLQSPGSTAVALQVGAPSLFEKLFPPLHIEPSRAQEVVQRGHQERSNPMNPLYYVAPPAMPVPSCACYHPPTLLSSQK